jgi:hypothetical protein
MSDPIAQRMPPSEGHLHAQRVASLAQLMRPRLRKLSSQHVNTRAPLGRSPSDWSHPIGSQIRRTTAPRFVIRNQQMKPQYIAPLRTNDDSQQTGNYWTNRSRPR